MQNQLPFDTEMKTALCYYTYINLQYSSER